MADEPRKHRNAFMEKAEKTRNLSNSHRRSVKQETSLAKTLGGKRTPASGARDVKGDVRIKGVARIEAKTTKNASFSVTREMIDKLEVAAASSGEVPVMVIEFNDGVGRKLKDVAVLPMWALETLLSGQD